MKRVWIVSGLVALILCLGSAALWHLSIATRELDTTLTTMSQSIEQQRGDLVAQAETFEALWKKHESLMLHYIHHDELDPITSGVARLKAQAQYHDYGELAAEIAELQHLIHHIYEAEIPSISTIF